jgi:hypothetical protein
MELPQSNHDAYGFPWTMGELDHEAGLIGVFLDVV